MRGTIDVKLRPIRFAFLVNPADTKGLRRALELNSALWGGMYNPIIPAFQRIPKRWGKSHGLFQYTSNKLLNGYIDAFDPDFLVPLGGCKKLDLKEFSQKVLDDKHLEVNLQEGAPDYGIGIFETLQGFFDKELKFVRKYPPEIVFASLPQKNRTFFQSIFGRPSKEITEILDKHWKEPLGVQDKKVNLENYATLLPFVNLRKLLSFDIKANQHTGWNRGECIFIMDASNNADIIDYWNLRALGWKILPVPIQAMGHQSVKDAAQKFIERYSGTHKHNPNVYYHSTVMKAPSVSEQHIKDFVGSLTIKPEEKAHGSRFSIQHWYPRMWDEWARDKDGVGPCSIESKTKTHDFNDDAEEMSIKTLTPEFAARFGTYHSDARFANEIAIHNYGFDEFYADVIPEGGKNLHRLLSHMSFDEWRFSKRTATYLSKHTNWTMHLKLHKAEEVFSAWMKDQGLEVNLSAPGKIAKQMVKHLGGKHGINMLASEDLIGVLKTMESGKPMGKEEFLGKMAKISNTRFRAHTPSELLKSYIDSKIFILGTNLQCPTCSHQSWHDINSLNYQLTCPNCFDQFSLPSHSPDDIKWAYKTSGPFSLPKRAEGVYPTLLTLRFFSTAFHHDSSLTPMMSFETKIEGKPAEVDLGLFFQKSRAFRESSPARVVFAECKSENDFAKKDVDKMKLLAEKFPGSVLVFATLKEDLNKKEVALLKPLVNKCRKYFKDEEPYNPVLILTKTELFSLWDLQQTWEDKGGKHAAFSRKSHHYIDGLLEISDISQQLYLGMKPWGEFISEQLEKRRARRRGALPST